MTLVSGLWAPKGTPKEIVAKLNVAAIEALNDSAVQQHLKNLGLPDAARKSVDPAGAWSWQKAGSISPIWWPIIKGAPSRSSFPSTQLKCCAAQRLLRIATVGEPLLTPVRYCYTAPLFFATPS